MRQASIPVEVPPAELRRKATLGQAIELCADLAGFALDKQLTSEMGVDKGQFSRWSNGTEGIVWPKLQALMDLCGNDAPMLWMLHQRGFDITSLRRLETDTERRLREANERISSMEAERKVERALLADLLHAGVRR